MYVRVSCNPLAIIALLGGVRSASTGSYGRRLGREALNRLFRSFQLQKAFFTAMESGKLRIEIMRGAKNKPFGP